MGYMRVYDSGGEDCGEAPLHWTHWGQHYTEFERDLKRTQQVHCYGSSEHWGSGACSF